MKTLLVKLRDKIKTTKPLTGGMCYAIHLMATEGTITRQEEIMLNNYLFNTKDSPNIKDRWEPNYRFWFRPGLRICRIKWLNKQIDKYTDESVSETNA